ncbi:MAG TPA: tRNA (adenosine(37)-N6)-dimethylallyltransferase MiaA, partial [bacterium]|nr:tRNA (adenosine(37)-N6)-dimethylallyltransferase MiaA [bacterium]
MIISDNKFSKEIEDIIKKCFDEKLALIIAGPTASGKTELAYNISEKYNIEIISADSRQIYKYLDIGTAKPSKEILEKLPHHLISIIEPNQRYSAAEFAENAENIISEIFQKNKLPIILGGTGFYIKALFNGLFEGPAADEKIRAELEKNNNDELFAQLQEIDKLTAQKFHKNDRKRIIRALEVYMITGKPISELQLSYTPKISKFKPFYIILDIPRKKLYDAINARADKMLKNGWIEETQEILKNGFNENCPAFEGLGYREIISFLNNRIDFDTLSYKIK